MIAGEGGAELQAPYLLCTMREDDFGQSDEAVRPSKVEDVN